MKKLIYFFFLAFLISCKNEKKTDLLDLKDVLPSSDRYAEGAEKQDKEEKPYYFDSLTPLSRFISDTMGVARESIQFIDSLWLPDRLDNQGVEKWRGISKAGEVQVAIFKFKDSLNMKNTLFNWLDCFDSKCTSLQLYEQKKVKGQPFLLYVTDKKIIYIQSTFLDDKQLLERFQGYFGKDLPRYVVSQTAGSKTNWWTFEEKKWKEIKLKEL